MPACAIGAVQSSPVIGDDGKVYFGSDDGYLRVVDSATGTLLWSYLTGGAIITSPAIGADGTIYVTSMDHYLYAIK